MKWERKQQTQSTPGNWNSGNSYMRKLRKEIIGKLEGLTDPHMCVVRRRRLQVESVLVSLCDSRLNAHHTSRHYWWCTSLSSKTTKTPTKGGVEEKQMGG